MAFNYSVMLDIEDKLVLVVGAGKVAYRKIESLLHASSNVVCIAPEFHEKLIALNNSKLKLLQRAFLLEDIQFFKPFLVIAATNDNSLNSQIAKYCAENNILVNSITDPELGNLSIQSIIHKKNFSVSISTYGNSPGFCKNLKSELNAYLESEKFDDICQIYKDIRLWLFETIPNPEIREKIKQKISFKEISTLLNDGVMTYDEVLEKVKKCLYC